MAVEVLYPGMATMLQDSGRYRWQHLGVPVCGAMDRFSHQLANALVGNGEDTATLEITLLGPRLRFLRRAVVVLTGADLSPQLDDQAVEMQRPFVVPAGGILSFGQRRQGARCYLAIKGGFLIPDSMGSQSTCHVGQFGGLAGRNLQKGDCLTFGWPLHNISNLRVPLSVPNIFPIADQTINFIAGKHWNMLTELAQTHFLTQLFRISPQSDRMGYRLDGEYLALREPINMYSEPVSSGTIQLPADGMPIILMADSQTTGGYPKIGHVTSTDMSLLAQSLPGMSFRFRQVSLHSAQSQAQKRRNWIAQITAH